MFVKIGKRHINLDQITFIEWKESEWKEEDARCLHVWFTNDGYQPLILPPGEGTTLERAIEQYTKTREEIQHAILLAALTQPSTEARR